MEAPHGGLAEVIERKKCLGCVICQDELCDNCHECEGEECDHPNCVALYS